MSELGVYSDFPTFSHLVVRLQLKKAGSNAIALITGALKRMNGLEDHVDTSVARHSGSIAVRRTFEVGIAEGLYFNYLDEREIKRISGLSAEAASMDYIIYINYRYVSKGRVNNLLPDRYIVRFSLSHSEMRLFQMSGLRRTDPEALVSIIAQLINGEAVALGCEGDIIRPEDNQEPQKN